MNAKQLLMLGLGLALAALMVLFPPWARIWKFSNNPQHSAPTVYRFIGTPPLQPQPRDFGLSDDYNVVLHTSIIIDWSRLVAQWLVVLALTIGGMVWFAESKSLSASLHAGPRFDLDEDEGGGKPDFDLDDEDAGAVRAKPVGGKKRIKLPPPPVASGPEPMVTEEDL